MDATSRSTASAGKTCLLLSFFTDSVNRSLISPVTRSISWSMLSQRSFSFSFTARPPRTWIPERIPASGFLISWASADDIRLVYSIFV